MDTKYESENRDNAPAPVMDNHEPTWARFEFEGDRQSDQPHDPFFRGDPFE